MEPDGWVVVEVGEHEGVGFVGGGDAAGAGFVFGFHVELAFAVVAVAQGG